MEPQPIHRVINLIGDDEQHIFNMTVDEARRLLLSDDRAAIAQVRGSFALVARAGERVRLARSLNRPLRYFLTEEREGPMLVVADRIDAIRGALQRGGPRGAVPSELHADGPGASRDGDPAGRLPGPQPRLPALLRSTPRRAAGRPGLHRDDVRGSPVVGDRAGAPRA